MSSTEAGPTSSFPIIDISHISEPSRQRAIAEEITAASAKWGFLLLKGHPIPSGEIRDMFSLSHDFFSLPESAKEPWPLNEVNVGYIGSFKDRRRDDKMSMWFGGVTGALENTQTEQLPPFWHAHTRQIEAFKRRCHDLVRQLLVCFAIALDLPDENFFARAHRADVAKGNALRMLMYPARGARPDGSTRMNAHTDSGSVTLLFQQAPGLEVLSPEGKWVPAPCIDDDTILVNLGDALSFWSGGQLKATLHRVTFDGLPHDKERQSMAYFGAATPDTVLEPVRPGGVLPKGYNVNDVEFIPGMTMGQYGEKIMRKIYGPPIEAKNPNRETGATLVAAS